MGIKLLDCTLRDGGYYNSWNFTYDIVNKYLQAMQSVGVNVVELGLRSLKNQGFKGANAYTTDAYLKSLSIPDGLMVGVMINASELVGDVDLDKTLTSLFPNPAAQSPVELVRIACHVHEFADVLPAANWLHEQGYKVGYNLMQIADRTEQEVTELAQLATQYPLDILYFADSMGGMGPKQTKQIIGWLRQHWKSEMGIHTHDNMGRALANSLQAIENDVTWIDATVTGMGRGPGNARTEEVAIELAAIRGNDLNLVPLMSLIHNYFQPLKNECQWGSNPYYYLSGKYGIHPTYVQEMMADNRYSEEDVFAVLDYLRQEGGKKYSAAVLDTARRFYVEKSEGSWAPKEVMQDKEVLLLGTGPGVEQHRQALEQYIKQNAPIVLALNTQTNIDSGLIDYRLACHPVRLLADVDEHVRLPQPLITPYSSLPENLKSYLTDKETKNFGLNLGDGFDFADTKCTLPVSLVMAYAFALVESGHASRLLLAGFDGYPGKDPRNDEMNRIVVDFKDSSAVTPLIAITPTRYDMEKQSVYGMVS